jgi:hypothetical protein
MFELARDFGMLPRDFEAAVTYAEFLDMAAARKASTERENQQRKLHSKGKRR